MNRAQRLIAECGCDKKKHTCPHCGKDFEEDNSQHVMHNAKMDEPPYVPDDKNTSGQASNNAGVHRKSIQDIIDVRYVKGN